MAYKFDKSTNDIIINGWENGIADSPYDGISDIRNINLISIPKEASVNFATSKISPTAQTGTVVSADAGTFYATYTGASTLENYMTIVFSVQAGLGVSTGVPYWIINLGVAGAGTFQVTSDFLQTTTVHLTNGTGTFAIMAIGGVPKYYTYASSISSYYLLTSNGELWNNYTTTTSGLWTYTGLSGTAETGVGTGLVYYQASNGTSFVFVFRTLTIDYFEIATGLWTYGWKPSDGTTHKTGYLKGSGIHDAIVAPDNKVYYCDNSWIGRWYQADPATPFVPTTKATYVFDETKVLPFTDVAQCLAPLGNNLLIGGKNNVVYPWDTFSQLPISPILIAESNIVKLITVNTNTFIFVGNRGRIYITNGSQAQLYKKIPDHLSGTVEPYFTWGGACSQKNQLYFSASVTSNSGTTIVAYGGLWSIDLDTKAIRLTNKLSYGTYGGSATAIIPNYGTNPNGTGLYIGWNSGAAYGIDTTTSSPYASGEAYIDSDLIPIGTYLKPNTNARLEFKLSVPLVSGESVKLQYRQKFSDSFADVSTTELFNTAGVYSGVYQNVPFQNSQWVQVRAVLTSTASSPSFCRLTEARIGN